MWVLCFAITFLCVYIVNETWQNTCISVGLASLMAITSGFFCAADQRRNDDSEKPGS